MRDNGAMSYRETSLPEGQVLVSRTSPDGRIRLCNSDLVEISGFSAGELTGAPHNLIRHRCCPRRRGAVLRARQARCAAARCDGLA